MQKILKYLNDKEWEIVYTKKIDEREGQYVDYSNLNLSSYSSAALSNMGKGIYKHQFMGINEFLAGNHVCVSTSTSSGKTLIFQICGIEVLSKDKDAKILAIYPLKALGIEQEEKWKVILTRSGLKCNIGRIDGAVSGMDRERIIKDCSIVRLFNAFIR